LNLCHTRAHLFNACLEGVGYGIAQHFDIFDAMQIGTKKVMAVGGGVKNPKWLQIVSDISGKIQHTVQEGAGAAYGDALLAALSVGFFKDVREIGRLIHVDQTIVPDEMVRLQYQAYKRRYTALYLATAAIMHE
jgi:xylulokinase